MPNYYKVSDNGQLEIDWLQLEQEFCREFVDAIRVFEKSFVNTQIVTITHESDSTYRAILKNDFSVSLIDCREGERENKISVCSIGKSEIALLSELFKEVE